MATSKSRDSEGTTPTMDVDEIFVPTPKEVVPPKYWRLKERLLRYCDQNRPGTMIPSERQLASDSGISRATVRQALQELVIEGRLTRAVGRGTVVAPPKLVAKISLSSMSEEMRAQGVISTTRVLSTSEVAASREVGMRLGLAEGSPVLVIERLRYANSECMAVDLAYFDPVRFSGLGDRIWAGAGLYETLDTVYGALPVRAEEFIDATVASPRVASVLCTETGAPLVLLQRHGFDLRGAPVEWSQSLFRGDRYRFVVDLGG